MNGLQIVNFFSLDPCTGPVFCGLAMSDFAVLPKKAQDRAVYVLNTDTYGGGGIHWCLVYFEGENEEFFDPFGQPPTAYGFDTLLKSKPGIKKHSYNRQPVQNLLSLTCGYHCLFFGFHRCRGYSMKEILDFYDLNDTAKNDEMVEEFVTRFGESYRIR